MKKFLNMLVARVIVRWGRRAGLAYFVHRGDDGCGKVCVREDNHGFHGYASLTLGMFGIRQALAQPIRVIRGYEMSWLQCFDRLRVEEEVDETHVGDAVVVVCATLKRIVGDDHFFERVACVAQREGFLAPLFFGRKGVGGLDQSSRRRSTTYLNLFGFIHKDADCCFKEVA